MTQAKRNGLISLIAGIALLALGIVMIPRVTSLGSSILKILIAIAIFAYVFLVLIPQFRYSKAGTVFILLLIETVLLLLIALGSILSQFNVIPVSGVFRIAGLALWLHGVVEMFRGYYRLSYGKRSGYPVWLFTLNLVLLSVGAWQFFAPLVADAVLVWILAVMFILAALVLIIIGISSLTHKKGK